MLINRNTLRTLFVAYRREFMEGLESSQDTINEAMRFAMSVPSSGKSNRYPYLGAFPKVREWLGDRVIQQLEANQFELVNRKFELTIEVEREDIEDDNFDLYGPMFRMLGRSVAEWPDDLLYEALRAGETGLAYDGQPFFSAAHPVGDSTVSNFDSGAADPWFLMDTSRPIKPLIWQPRIAPTLTPMDKDDDANVFEQDKFLYGARMRGNAGYGAWQTAYKSTQALTDANFESALQAMMEFQNSEGASLNIRPNLLVVPPALRAEAHDLLERKLIGSGDSNPNYKAVDLLVTTRLVGAT